MKHPKSLYDVSTNGMSGVYYSAYTAVICQQLMFHLLMNDASHFNSVYLDLDLTLWNI